MKLAARSLLESDARTFYLYGEDEDAIAEMAERLFRAVDGVRLRLDVSELKDGRIEAECRNQGLFGASNCVALVRNTESIKAKTKIADHVLQLSQQMPHGSRLILCAPNVSWKSSFHKDMQALSDAVHCEFSLPDVAQFSAWLSKAVQDAGLQVDETAQVMIAERLCGMRGAARQLLQRLQYYDGGAHEQLSMQVVGDLLGDRAPEDLEDYCHAVAARSPESLLLLRRMVTSDQVAAVQLLTWLEMRMTMLLMYRWFESLKDRNALQKAKVFGAARSLVPKESHAWTIAELFAAMRCLLAAEKKAKGASLESDAVFLERMTMDLVVAGRLL